MDLNAQKEDFSIAYVRAVAAVAGFSVERPERDEGVDLKICDITPQFPTHPELHVQVKSTSASCKRNGNISYPLDVKNYDDLRIQNLQDPRVLVVVLLPPALEDWIDQSEEEMVVRHCGYWCSLRGAPDVANVYNKTIDIPSAQRFDVEQLLEMMSRAARREDL